MGKFIKLLAIDVVNGVNNPDIKDILILATPTAGLEMEFKPSAPNSTFVNFIITYSVGNLQEDSIFKLVTKSSYEIEEPMSAFIASEDSQLIDLLAHLATLAMSHNQGIFSILHKHTILINSAGLYSHISPMDFRDSIVDILSTFDR